MMLLPDRMTCSTSSWVLCWRQMPIAWGWHCAIISTVCWSLVCSTIWYTSQWLFFCMVISSLLYVVGAGLFSQPPALCVCVHLFHLFFGWLVVHASQLSHICEIVAVFLNGNVMVIHCQSSLLCRAKRYAQPIQFSSSNHA